MKLVTVKKYVLYVSCILFHGKLNRFVHAVSIYSMHQVVEIKQRHISCKKLLSLIFVSQEHFDGNGWQSCLLLFAPYQFHNAAVIVWCVFFCAVVLRMYPFSVWQSDILFFSPFVQLKVATEQRFLGIYGSRPKSPMCTINRKTFHVILTVEHSTLSSK